jgi:hypothetical protein
VVRTFGYDSRPRCRETRRSSREVFCRGHSADPQCRSGLTTLLPMPLAHFIGPMAKQVYVRKSITSCARVTRPFIPFLTVREILFERVGRQLGARLRLAVACAERYSSERCSLAYADGAFLSARPFRSGVLKANEGPMTNSSLSTLQRLGARLHEHACDVAKPAHCDRYASPPDLPQVRARLEDVQSLAHSSISRLSRNRTSCKL